LRCPVKSTISTSFAQLFSIWFICRHETSLTQAEPSLLLWLIASR
jgi:hypothetical protein